MRNSSLAGLYAALGLSLAIPVAASAQDWDIDAEPHNNTIVASLSYDSGLTLMVSCKDTQLNVGIVGLPRAEGRFRPIEYTFPAKPERNERWVIYGDGTTAFSTMPTQLSRDLMAGGDVKFTVPAKDSEPAKSYSLNLPEGSDAIRQVMDACGRPVQKPVPEEYPADDMPFNPRWTTKPNPTSIPFEINGRVDVFVSCETGPRGRVQNCFIESAHPWIDRVNQVILRYARRGVLVDQNTGQPYPIGNRFVFHVPSA